MAESGAANLTCPFHNLTTPYAIDATESNETVMSSLLTRILYFPQPKLEVKDEVTETQHIQDGIVLIIIIFLLFITIITIWVFKALRIRVCHETGLAMLYGRGCTCVSRVRVLISLCVRECAYARVVCVSVRLRLYVHVCM